MVQLVQVSLDGSTTFWCNNKSSQFCIIGKLSKLKTTGMSTDPWGTPLEASN